MILKESRPVSSLKAPRFLVDSLIFLMTSNFSGKVRATRTEL